MAIISISRGSYSHGVEVAEAVAERLGYSCLARDVVLQASEEYNIPEIQLVRAIEDPPTVFQRLTHGRRRYVAYVRAALLRHFAGDKIVYHGLAGHYFLRGVDHALKVRIIADLEDRVRIVMDRDHVSEDEARRTLTHSDKVRRQWGLHLYGIDPEDPSLYDAVIHVGRMGLDGATSMICNMVDHEPFATTAQSQAALEDLALAAAIEAEAVEMELDLEATAHGGDVTIRVKKPPRVRAGSYSEFRDRYVADLQQRLYQRSIGLPGFKSLEVVLAD